MNSGCVRVTGVPTGGKTSFTLSLLKNFLDGGNNVKRRGVYFRSEGRLSADVKNRSGITFVQNPDDFADGTCLIVDSNVYEFVFGLIRELILNNNDKTQYFFVIDSSDMLCKRDDLQKPFEEAHQSPGGAMLTGVFLKKVALALAKRGHTMFFISQKRDIVKIDPRQKVAEKQGGSSGGWSLKHQIDIGFEFLGRSEFNGDFIREKPNDKTSKIIGHWCNVKLFKGDEKNESLVRFPIKYGCKNGNSVWLSYEVTDMLLGWNLIKKAGAGWMTLSPGLREELLPLDKDVPEKIQGEDNIRIYLDEHPEVLHYLYDKFKALVTS